MIKLEDIVKKYSDTKIGPVDIQFPKSGFISLIGPNGAGKSTLLNIMGRLLTPDIGSVYFDKININEEKTDIVAKMLTILKQTNDFTTKLTVKQLVSFGRYPYSKGNISKNDEKIIDEYIDFFGLESMQNKYISQLSGGQKQRACIAMILAQQTPYILLDEPLNNLDISKSIEIMQYLKKACSNYDKTIVCVMHDINFALKYSDYICAMKDGKVIAFGRTDEIISKDLLSQIYGVNLEIIQTPKGKFVYY